MTDKCKRLKNLLTGASTSFLMEAHDGLSARVVEKNGFQGIWASGLSISSSLGVRDCSEASWSEVGRTVAYMTDTTGIPILLDGDSGYGNFNAVRILVRKLGQMGVAGVCIEDALFPKLNSFVGEQHPLLDVAEFCGKMRAAKDSQTSDDFCVVARVEALVSGRSMSEALDRAQAYHEAGADAILIHSKKSDATEILTFCERWNRRAPLVVVPTKYYKTPTSTLQAAGVSTIIWANHNLRAAMQAMDDVSRRIFEHQSVAGVEGEIATLDSLFALMDYDELAHAEARYVPRPHG
jgi:phosphoenolpyruvate phosphomutase